MITKITALALGWYLPQKPCRFFHATHLMHFDEQSRGCLPMRVKESQPVHSPMDQSISTLVA